jgi:hypothetical protein
LPFLRNHPRCRSFNTLGEAVRAICAQRDATVWRVAS